MLFKSLLLVSCLVLIQGAVVPEADDVPVVHILNDEQMEKFLLENPNALELTPEVSVEKSAARLDSQTYSLSWTMGARKSGDAAVFSTSSAIQYFDGPSYPSLFIQYPKSGTGKIVTHVTIFVQQSTPLGTVYVTDGGINERNIEFYVKGYETTFYGWTITIYGKDN